MGKWLAALGVVLLVVLVLLWRQLESPTATAAPAPEPERAPTPAFAGAPAETEPEPAAEPAAAAAPAPAEEPKPADDKMDPQSDEFFRKHDEIVVPNLMRQAVKCWENLPLAKRKEFHRNQSLVATFKQRIRDGVVTIHDVVVERSSISDPALEACFLQQIRGATWTNKRLPDWDQEDTIKLGPRTLKKYTRWNIEADEGTPDEGE